MITLDYSQIINFLSWAKVSSQTEPGDINILCLQGITPIDGTPNKISVSNTLQLNDNKPDMQNDTIIIAAKDKNGVTSVTSFVGTIEPGRYYTITDPNPAGAAHLVFGQHQYVKGLHKSVQPALRGLNEKNRVWRDKNGNFKLDAGEYAIEGAFGINMHAGSSSDYIGMYSAGCINIGGKSTGTPYKKFLELLDIHDPNYNYFKPQGLPRPIYVTLWRGLEYEKFVTQGWSVVPTLYNGMKNLWVADMQKLLSDKGFAVGVIDGDWGAKTTTSLMAFQKSKGLVVDNVCGSITWAALKA